MNEVVNMRMSEHTWNGYKRLDGRTGIRNKLLVIDLNCMHHPENVVDIIPGKNAVFFCFQEHVGQLADRSPVPGLKPWILTRLWWWTTQRRGMNL